MSLTWAAAGSRALSTGVSMALYPMPCHAMPSHADSSRSVDKAMQFIEQVQMSSRCRTARMIP
ncbi:uncharacterized protein MYCFIDRAFT_183798 [Pseudocercospora fijiensis CIRAD86]|uniref:Uncharacterized protein n=1 Tax=Pseudocercospora fijiensis (strain CIRAD86) TaxID=383855 RepID=M2ZKZ4_PSEFD|nr:uncharacterized protein MYCFIDRAFT_183798 [Pseudocercospora fijiensis CIRAD86]EME79724.1 hypothetical protein MYCFIDRAFT_183798 [Pseudocercospora fijiensis CIRAD86]